MSLHPAGPGTVVGRPRDFPANRGGLCQKGWTETDLLRNGQRLTTPLVRDRRDTPFGLADYAGISYDRIVAQDGVFWPCLSPDRPGTPRMFLGRFATPDGRARFLPVEHRPAAEDLSPRYPVYLTTGRLLQHYQSGAQTMRVAALREAQPEPFGEMHPDLAARHTLADGDRVRVISRRGPAEGQVRITDTVRADNVFIPFHRGGAGSVNRVTNPALDPVSKMPKFKVCAVRLEKLT